MKNYIEKWAVVLVFIFTAGAFMSCEDKYTEEYTYKANVPKYLSYENLRKSVKAIDDDQRDLQKPGKIYFKDHYLFINELFKGIHIFDNTNPSQPEKIAFIEIPGNVDMAIRDHYLYADSYVDLVVLDIEDLQNISETFRLQNIFQYTYPECDYTYPISNLDEQKGVIVDWNVEQVTEKVERQRTSWWGGNKEIMYDATVNYSARESSPSVTTGVGGSLARFIIYKNSLYTVNQWVMQTFDISSPDVPAIGNQINLNRLAETLFVNGSNLFVGTQTGMMVYSLEFPASPVFISELAHIQSCDPVVVENNIAYVTLRAGNACGGFSNQLDVIDISNISNPQLIKSYPMTEPYGLGIDDNVLFICDGSAGLKVYNASDPETIGENMITSFPGIHAYDVIPMDKVLMMIGEDGLYQYDYSDLDNLEVLSIIPFNKN